MNENTVSNIDYKTLYEKIEKEIVYTKHELDAYRKRYEDSECSLKEALIRIKELEGAVDAYQYCVSALRR